MYNLKITNNYHFAVSTSDPERSVTIKPNDSGEIDNLGTTILNVPGMGQVLFLDLGENKIEGYPLEETWGVLVRYQSVEFYYRYEGQGEIVMSFDTYGDIDIISVQGSGLIIALDEFTYSGASD